MGKNAPAAPDYTGAAKQTGQASQANINAQTQANRPNQNTAFGGVQWSQGPGGVWTQNTSLNPTLGGAAGSLEGQVASGASSPLMTGDQARDQAIKGAYDQSTSRLDPQWNQRQEQLDSQLANEGLDRNSEAYRTATSQFGRDRNDAYSSAMNNAIGQGTSAGAATFNENLAAHNNPLAQLQGLQGLTTAPGFNAAGSAQAPDYLGAAGLSGQYGLQATQMNNKNMADILGGAAQLGGAAAAFSDERLKENITRLPVDAIPGVPLSAFEYSAAPGQQHLGVIAQDLEKVAPEHVMEGPGGVKMVSPAFAPQPLGGPKFLTPKDAQEASQLAAFGDKRARLAAQIAALRQPAGEHSTGWGAALGGIGSVLNAVNAKRKGGEVEDIARQQEPIRAHQFENASSAANARSQMEWNEGQAKMDLLRAQIQALKKPQTDDVSPPVVNPWGG